MTEYQKYQLQWMIEHGYSLENLMNKIANIINEELSIEGNAHIFINEAFTILQDERGFVESEIWACEDEWKDNEAKKFNEEGLFILKLTSKEKEMISKALDYYGDKVADSQGYSIGEKYWDLANKIMKG